MTASGRYARYGVRLQHTATEALDLAEETLRLLGYAVVESGLDERQLDALREDFDRLRREDQARYGAEMLLATGENDLIRCPLANSPRFLALACNPRILALVGGLLGPSFILNQQNGIINPAGALAYSQSAYHRDLPYQHFVSSRPLAVNALFCLDAFTLENGATFVIPASHKQEAFSSEAVISAQQRQLAAPAGSFLVLDAMTFHCGGTNRTQADRRAVNHLYTVAAMRQQIDLPACLGDDFSADPQVRQLLGFNHRQPRSLAEYHAGRVAARVAPKG